MEFKLILAVFCLASIRMSEAATIVLAPAFQVVNLAETAVGGTALTYTAITGGTLPFLYTAAFVSDPTSGQSLFELTTAGVLTTKSTATFSATTTSSYTLTITLTDNNDPIDTGSFVLIIVIKPSSGTSAIIPSVVVTFISLLAMLFQRK